MHISFRLNAAADVSRKLSLDKTAPDPRPAGLGPSRGKAGQIHIRQEGNRE